MITFSSCSQSETSLSGSFTDMKNDTLYIFSAVMDNNRQWISDTVVMTDNCFEVKLPETLLHVYITPKSKMPADSKRYTKGQPILYFPGDQLHVQGTSEKYIVSGSELYEGMRLHGEVEQLQTEVNN